jgi:hypothetical protein
LKDQALLAIYDHNKKPIYAKKPFLTLLTKKRRRMLDFSAGLSKNLPLNALIGGLTSADNARLITVCAEGIVSSL